jgi:pectate lyase
LKPSDFGFPISDYPDLHKTSETTSIMKFTSAITTLFATLAVASPLESRDALLKRQAAEPCTVGYCTQNGGTTGGAKGSTVTVTTVAALIEAAKRTEPLTIIVSGKLTGSDRVRPASDKTIIGAAGSCKSTLLLLG